MPALVGHINHLSLTDSDQLKMSCAFGELWLYYCMKLFQVQVHKANIYLPYIHIDTTDPSDPTDPTPRSDGGDAARSVCFAFHVLTVKVNKNNKMASPGTCILATFI